MGGYPTGYPRDREKWARQLGILDTWGGEGVGVGRGSSVSYDIYLVM